MRRFNRYGLTPMDRICADMKAHSELMQTEPHEFRAAQYMQNTCGECYQNHSFEMHISPCCGVGIDERGFCTRCRDHA